MKIFGGKSFKTRQAAQKIGSFGKKWKPGDKLRAFYRIGETPDGDWDLLVGALWGHKADFDALGMKRSFLPTTSELDDDGNVVKKDIIYQTVPVMRLLFDGIKQEKVNKIKNNDGLPDSAKDAAIKKIDKDYENKRPALGGLEYKIFTECVVVPVNEKDEPIWKDASLVSQDLSKKKYRAIYDAINNVKNWVDKENGFVEISYVFGNDEDKKVAGDITPLGVSAQEAISFCAPEEPEDSPKYINAQKALNYCKDLPDDSDTIIKRNANSKPISPAEFKEAITTYAALNATDALDALAGDEKAIENMEKAVDAIRLYHISVHIPKIVEKLEQFETDTSHKEQSDAPNIDELQGSSFSKEEIEEIKENASESEDFEASSLSSTPVGNITEA